MATTLTDEQVLTSEMLDLLEEMHRRHASGALTPEVEGQFRRRLLVAVPRLIREVRRLRQEGAAGA